MTAVNIVRQRDSVHVFSDASTYDAGGILHFAGLKTFALPHHPAVVATRGPNRASDIIGLALASTYATFDDMIDGIEHDLPGIIEASAKHLGGGGFGRIDLMIAGWSERNAAPQSYAIQSERNDWRPDANLGAGIEFRDGGEPFSLQELPELVVSPVILQAEIVAAIKPGRGFSDIQDFDLDAHGLMLLELQRAQRCSLMPGGPERHWVGGFAMVASVSKAGIAQRLLHRWNDQIGEVIEPAPINWRAWWSARNAAAVAAIPTGLSRLQRERMEKKARKGTLRAV